MESFNSEATICDSGLRRPSRPSTLPLLSLPQVEKIANRSGFGSTSNVHVDAAQKSISLVLLASAEARRPPSANESKRVGSRGGSDAGVTDAHAPTALESDMIKYVAAARLRMTARLSQG